VCAEHRVLDETDLALVKVSHRLMARVFQQQSHEQHQRLWREDHPVRVGSQHPLVAREEFGLRGVELLCELPLPGRIVQTRAEAAEQKSDLKDRRLEREPPHH
jgi:hypothetical protein